MHEKKKKARVLETCEAPVSRRSAATLFLRRDSARFLSPRQRHCGRCQPIHWLHKWSENLVAQRGEIACVVEKEKQERLVISGGEDEWMSSSEPRRLSRLSSLLHCCLSGCAVPPFVLPLEEGPVVGPAGKKKKVPDKGPGSTSESTRTFNLLSNGMNTQQVATRLKPNVCVLDTISCLILNQSVLPSLWLDGCH